MAIATEIAKTLQDRFGRCLVIAAHPDDESLGAAAPIAHLPGTAMTYVTDGAPRNLQDARAYGFTTREDYAQARIGESRQAAGILGVAPRDIRALGIVDQEASLDLFCVTYRILEAICDVQPGFVITHSYEGRHPDHDATAFGVHAAARIQETRGRPLPVIEFASYHNATGFVTLGRFIPRVTTWGAEARLSPAECDLKREAIQAHKTQLRVTAGFPVDVERYRLAPRYRFTAPPHPGTLYYEHFNWGIDGNGWRAKASQTLHDLQLSEPL